MAGRVKNKNYNEEINFKMRNAFSLKAQESRLSLINFYENAQGLVLDIDNERENKTIRREVMSRIMSEKINGRFRHIIISMDISTS